MQVTLLGIVIFSNELHLSNEPILISFKPSGNIISLKLSHNVNALSPI